VRERADDAGLLLGIITRDEFVERVRAVMREDAGG